MTKFRITAPEAGFTGISVDVVFKDGVAEIEAPGDNLQHEDTRRVAYFSQAGYGVEVVDDEPVDEEPPPADVHATVQPLPAKSASKDEWVAAAVIRGLDLDDAKKATKEQLIELLNTPEENA